MNMKFMRVDFRLLHGQVGMNWVPFLGADCLLIANDEVLKNPLMVTSIKMAKPAGVKLVIKSIADSIEALNSGVTDKYKLMIVVESVEDAYALLNSYSHTQLNIGATKFVKGKNQILDGFYVDENDMELLNKLVLKGVKVEHQMIPSSSVTDVSTLLK